MLTTLTAAVVLPTKDNKFHLCVCNVGDSLAYVYSKVPVPLSPLWFSVGGGGCVP
jgi:serine/threonine protein phosphatase PrpC